MKFGPFGVWEIIIILLLVLLFFGPRRLPELAKSIGQSVREFRKGIRDFKEDIDTDLKSETKATNTTKETAVKETAVKETATKETATKEAAAKETATIEEVTNL